MKNTTITPSSAAFRATRTGAPSAHPMGLMTADAVAAYAGKQRVAPADGAVTTPGSPAWRPLA